MITEWWQTFVRFMKDRREGPGYHTAVDSIAAFVDVPEKNSSQRSFEKLWLQLWLKGDHKFVYAELVKMYEGHHYHNLRHVGASIGEIEAFVRAHKGVISDKEYALIRMALWFHDVKDSEADSADYAVAILRSAGMSNEDCEAVHSYINATTHKTVPSDLPQQIIVDADLSILGQPHRLFEEYESGIRKEYATVPADIFAEKRVEILEKFLKRQAIYHTPYFRDLYEARARKNLAWSIAKLRDSIKSS